MKAPSEHGDDAKAREQSASAVRNDLRERISRAPMEERTSLKMDAITLASANETAEIVGRAEAAVAAAGSPEAALLAAVSRGQSAQDVHALLRRGANPDAAFLDRSALAVAARVCSADVVKVLIDEGATLDMKDVWGWTPLMHAIDAHTLTCSREATLMLLLDRGASVDVWGKDLKGPLDLMKEREEMIMQQQQQQKQRDSGPNASATASQHAQALLPTVQCPPAHQSAVNGGVSFGMGKERPRRLAALLRQKSAGHQPHHGAIFNVIGHQCTPQVIDETQPSGGTARSRSCRSAA